MKQNVFYDFEFPVLKYPLRNQKKIVQYALDIQNSGENVKSGYYNNVATSFELDIPSNLADGSQVITIDGGKGFAAHGGKIHPLFLSWWFSVGRFDYNGA